MDPSSALKAIHSQDGLKMAVGLNMLNKVKDMQQAQVAAMLADFQAAQPSPAPHPHAGQRVDLRG